MLSLADHINNFTEILPASHLDSNGTQHVTKEAHQEEPAKTWRVPPSAITIKNLNVFVSQRMMIIFTAYCKKKHKNEKNNSSLSCKNNMQWLHADRMIETDLIQSL